MEIFLFKALQLVAALSLLVLIHEFGHYIFARIFGIKVDKFYLFFNPWFKIASWKPKAKPGVDTEAKDYKPTWRDTEYGIGWLPLGGYCAIAGMIDENTDTNTLSEDPKDWEFRSKPAWQRLLVMMGGVLFNFILAILIYAGIAFYFGEKYVELDKAYAGMDFTETARSVGFRDGDVILTADGKPLDFGKSTYNMDILTAKRVGVLRNGSDTVDISIPADFALKVNEDGAFMSLRVPVFVDKVLPGEAAQAAGLKPGDHIVQLGDSLTPSFGDLNRALAAYAGKKTTVAIERGTERKVIDITPSEGGKLGFQLKNITDVYPTVSKSFGLIESLPQGWKMGVEKLTAYASSMKFVATKEGAKSLGGFGALGSMYPDKWNWLSFWEITAFLSVALAFMNFLPIPALDGGHIMFLLWEMITRRKVPVKVLEMAQYIGMAFLILLLIYANGNDIFRFLIK